MAIKPSIVWFRRDLRLSDNAALAEAIAAGGPIVPVFIWSGEADEGWSTGAASRWWLHHALASLNQSFEALGGRLFCFKGEAQATLHAVVETTGAARVYWNRRYEAPLRASDAAVKRALHEAGVEVKSFNSSLLNEPHTVSTGSNRPYKVYTPYWRKVKDRTLTAPVATPVDKAHFFSGQCGAVALGTLGLLSGRPWEEKLAAHWEISEKAALERLEDFLSATVNDYDRARDFPDESGTSKLSPYLHWGLIGPRQVMHRLRELHDLRAEGPHTYGKEIYWREFAYNVLYHFPHTPEAPLQEKYADFPWQPDRKALRRWQQGRTGYPIVDAGMRELWATGWMHNRVRMIVSSLLVKHLLQDWQAGARWFWDTLVDADLASNTLGWQWSGGCGADAAPYFRIFNPMTQGRKFDPEGHYVRRWVPELAELPKQYIHEPWEAPETVLEQAGCRLGRDYPRPVIDHKEGRQRALAAFDQVKEAS